MLFKCFLKEKPYLHVKLTFYYNTLLAKKKRCKMAVILNKATNMMDLIHRGAGVEHVHPQTFPSPRAKIHKYCGYVSKHPGHGTYHMPTQPPSYILYISHCHGFSYIGSHLVPAGVQEPLCYIRGQW